MNAVEIEQAVSELAAARARDRGAPEGVSIGCRFKSDVDRLDKLSEPRARMWSGDVRHVERSEAGR